MYSPMVAMLVAAENATELPRLGKPKIKLSVHASHTMNDVNKRLHTTLCTNNTCSYR